jgi:hypothetical protein
MQYNLTWINNDTISGLTFNYPINSSSDLQLPNYSNSVGSGYSLIQAVSLTDFNGNTRPFPAGSSPDRGALENLLGSPANASPIVNPVQNIQINEDEITTIALTGIGDGDYFSSQNISISAFSDNFTLMPNPIVSYTSGSNSAILTLSPELNQSGTLTVTVALQDDGGTVNGGVDQTTITFQVTIVPVNDAPIVSDDLGSTDEETPVTINVISNDSDLDGNINPTSVTIATLPANGTATVDPLTGIVTYTPNLNFIGTDSFGYQVCDDGTPLPAECEQGTVTVTVDPVNDVPVLTADNTNTDEEIPVMIDLLTNDSDVDGNLDPETVEIIINPSNGTVTIDPVTGEATYTPNLDFNGTDAFVYQVCDDGTPLPALCSQATVTITVDPINDQPIAITLSGNTIPENQIGMIGEFSTVDIDANDNFSYTLVAGIGSNDNNLFSISGSQLSNNTTFNFEVQNTYSIRVRSTDSGGLSTEEVFSIEVLNVNDIIIDFSGGNTYCNGTEAIGWINTVVTESNGPLDYSWSGPGGFFSDEQNISGLESGQYTLTVTDDLNSQSAVTTIEVIPTYEDLAVCYVTSDSINTLRNRIYFSNPGIYNIEKYQILRESSVAGVYDLIGQVNAADTSFLDNGSDNSAVSYKYRVRSVDSCGNFSSESASHRTILLQANLGLNNTVNLNWSPYDGVSYSTYVLYKSTNGSSFEELISLPTSNTTFNDVAADVSLNTYIYYVAIPISTCDFMKVNNMIRSNEKALSPLSVNDLSQPLSVAVYPNPTFSSVTVEGEWIAGQEFVIFDLQGREVYNGRFKSIKEMIDLKNLSKGQYILRVGLNDVRITKD